MDSDSKIMKYISFKFEAKLKTINWVPKPHYLPFIKISSGTIASINKFVKLYSPAIPAALNLASL